MGAVAVFSGKSGAGKSTLLKALVLENPRFFRFMTIVTTRKPKESDVQHPTNASWSEYTYVNDATFDFWLDRGHLIQPAADTHSDVRFGLLLSTIQNVLEFKGCVVANLPPAYLPELHQLFVAYEYSVSGIFLHVPDAVAHRRMIERGNTESEARANMLLGEKWPEMAAELGYRFVENPDEPDRVPRQALAKAKQLIGLN